MEIDELQRQHGEAFSLQQQLAAARQGEAQLRKRCGELSQMLAAAQQAQRGGGGGSQAGDASPGGSTASTSRAASGKGRSVRLGPGGGGGCSSAHAGSPSRSASLAGSVAGGSPARGRQEQQQQQGAADAEAGGLSQQEADALRQQLARLKRERDRLQVGPCGCCLQCPVPSLASSSCAQPLAPAGALSSPWPAGRPACVLGRLFPYLPAGRLRGARRRCDAAAGPGADPADAGHRR